MPTFIGIDLAWQSDRNHSGGAVLEGDQSVVILREVSSGLGTLADALPDARSLQFARDLESRGTPEMGYTIKPEAQRGGGGIDGGD